ncbi:MAG: hypothetical protein JNL58_29190 [Planctomyces sp.]|nr:hypothetical protein [Planctomyces sp.]
MPSKREFSELLRVHLVLDPPEQVRGFSKLICNYLPPDLAMLWLNPERTKPIVKRLDAEEFWAIAQEQGLSEDDADKLKDAFVNGNVVPTAGILWDAFREQPGATVLAYVGLGRQFLLNSRILVPVRWYHRDSCPSGSYLRDDRRLPNSLLHLAQKVRNTLKQENVEGESHYRSAYDDWTLHFWPELAPPSKWLELEPDPQANLELGQQVPERILDAIFVGLVSSESAFTSLITSLFVAVRGGKAEPFCLATGCGSPGPDGRSFKGVRSVGPETISDKLLLAEEYARLLQLAPGQSGKKVRFFLPESQIAVANKFLENNQSVKEVVEIDPDGFVTGRKDSLLQDLRAMRQWYQCRPTNEDSLEAQQSYFSSLATQSERSEFHVTVMQEGTLSGHEHVVPKLREQWEAACGGLTALNTYCISILSRSWELPFLDRKVFQPKESLVIAANDGDTASKVDATESLIKVQQHDISVQNVDIRNTSASIVEERIKEIVTAFINDIPNGQSCRLIFNRTSGSAFLTDCLIKAAPQGAFVVTYAGQTDTKTNQPIPGKHTLVVQERVGEFGLKLISGDAQLPKTSESVAAESGDEPK